MKKERIFWGLALVAAAAGIIAGKLGYVENVNVISLLLTVFLLSIIIKSIRPLNFSGILFPIAFLCIIYDSQLGIEALTPWTVLLAALLGSIGLSMVFGSCKRAYKGKTHCHCEDDFVVIDEADDSCVQQKTSFGASSKYINSDNFSQAYLECSFGAMKVYFDRAIVRNGQAAVILQVNFAGMELYIPKEWKVENHVSMTLGAVEEKNRSCPDGQTTLKLTGSGSFAGVEIIYV